MVHLNMFHRVWVCFMMFHIRPVSIDCFVGKGHLNVGLVLIIELCFVSYTMVLTMFIS